MAATGIKRRAGGSRESQSKKPKITIQTTKPKVFTSTPSKQKSQPAVSSDSEHSSWLDEEESSATSQESNVESDGQDSAKEQGKRDAVRQQYKTRTDLQQRKASEDSFLNGSTSKEAHAKQKALAHERKGAKPNADLIARSKKLWERLRRKSHVPKDERRKLVEELFEIINGRVKDFVFKHDAVRVIQTALKYARPEQRGQIAMELQGEYRALAESKYAKFLVAKLVDDHAEIRDMVVAEFYGHAKRLIRHPEASWIVDDIYRTIATASQKACMLREWYGPEFVIFKPSDTHDTTAELSLILERNPEKRGPIMQHLRDMTNQLVQKKATGYTMLHDALLQYFLNCKPGSPEATEFLEMLKDDEEGDCYKNLAFTESGSKLTCLALAYGTAKDRRSIMRFFKGVIKMLAANQYGHLVLLTAYEVIDDTVMTAKAIFPELLGKDLEQEQRDADLLLQAGNLTARKPLLYLFDTGPSHWLPFQRGSHLQAEIRDIRSTTSKKDPETRRVELVRAISQPLLDFISRQVGDLTKSGFGCQFLSEVILGSEGDKSAALEAVAEWANENMETSEIPGSGRMLKTLIHDGRYDKSTKDVKLIEPPLGFSDLLYEKTEGRMSNWATSSNSFVVVAFLEAKRFTKKDKLVAELEKNRSLLEGAAQMGNSGAKISLQRLNER